MQLENDAWQTVNDLAFIMQKIIGVYIYRFARNSFLREQIYFLFCTNENNQLVYI